MRRVQLEYFDQNESFSACLPRAGYLVGRHSSSDSSDDWYHVVLDETVSYQMKLSGSLAFRNVETSDMLIRSRWSGQEVGAKEPTSVFLLLVQPSQLPLPSRLRIEDYLHVAWGMCHTIE
jgi:hypothetical protein